jgi:hypothetical protein
LDDAATRWGGKMVRSEEREREREREKKTESDASMASWIKLLKDQ